jgi:serine/threonine protein kinase
MSKLIGGELIGTGTYGCVHKPQMECTDDTLNATPGAVSKIMLKLDARKEMREFKHVTGADRELTMHLGTPTLCDVKDTDENKYAIDECNNSGLTRTTFYKDKLQEYALLVMKDGGQDITGFAHVVYGWAITDENKNKIELFWLEVSRLFYGLKVFKDAGLIHRDLNQNNIVYNIDANRLNFIDFGFMTRKEDMYNAVNYNKFNNQSGWSRPWETSYLNAKDYAKIADENERYNYEPLPVTLRPLEMYDYFFESILPTNANKYQLADINKSMSAVYYKMKGAHIISDGGKFFEKSIDTTDSYGVGLALLYALTRSGKFLDPDLYNMLNVLFTNMINPSVYDRRDVDGLIAEYRRIITESGLLAKHNKNYDDNFLLVNNEPAVEVPQPTAQEIVVPGGSYRPRSRKYSQMSKSTRNRKPTKRTRSRKANKAKRSHNKR